MAWFDEKYDNTSTATPVLIHNTHVLHKQASARPGARVITFAKLAKLREAARKYAAALAADNTYQKADMISAQLATWGLDGKSFIQKWGVAPRKR